MKEDIVKWEDDGLQCLDAGPWVLEKYRTLYNYVEMFATGMKGRWGKRVYIDLYAGPGVARIRSTGRLYKGSPLLAMVVKDKFDKYILCEEDKESIDALKQRIEAKFSKTDVTLVHGKCDDMVADIMAAIPKYSKGQTVLSFCFADPFSLNLEFKTIKKLASGFVDFLILLALDMDVRRNVATYLTEQNTKIDRFLGNENWRHKWNAYSRKDDSIQRFLANEFETQMIELGYRKAPKGNTLHVRTNDRNLPLYHLAFFSRHPRGYEFWDEVMKYRTSPSLFDS